MGNLKWLVFMEKGKPKYPENNGENKQQTQPTYGVDIAAIS